MVIDRYWHSSVVVDAPPGGGGGGENRKRGAGGNAARAAGRNRDQWAVTIGDSQYAWLKRTFETSRARYKFVFAHHVMGTGRGAIEGAGFCQWGGHDPRGTATFQQKRPTWEMPIHQFIATIARPSCSQNGRWR